MVKGTPSGVNSNAPGHTGPAGVAGRPTFKTIRAVARLGASGAVAALLLAGSWSLLSAGDGGPRSGYFTLEVTPPSLQVCIPADAEFQVDVNSFQGFSDPVTLSTAGTPSGTTSSFAPNPVIPPAVSQLTIGNTGAATAGLYDIEIVGVAPTATITVTATLELIDGGTPGAVGLLSPPNGAAGQLQAPRFEWDSVVGSTFYELEIATNPGFNPIAYGVVTDSTVHTPSVALQANTLHYWRVRAGNVCGPGPNSAVFSFTTSAAAPVLLVDDDDDAPDVRPYYGTALDSLGLPYDVYDTRNSDQEPTVALLELYPAVIWFSGAAFTAAPETGVAGPGGPGEDALAAYLDGSGCFLLSSQDYLWDHGLTPFGADHLGIGSYTSDVVQTTVTGHGSVFGGLGPYTLAYPFSNYSDEVVPAPYAELAFVGNVADAAVTRAGSSYRSVFFGYPLEALPTDQDRQDVLVAAFLACSQVFGDGFESGDVSRWSASFP